MIEPGCFFCGEPFDDPQEATIPVNLGPRRAHKACLMRSIVGGVNHQRGTCSCCGGRDEPDPPELSQRQAARVAFEFWLEHHP